MQEAARIEQSTAKRLLKERRLSLILDLDQTVIHATINPTVDDWLHEPKYLKKYPHLKDIYRFKLPDSPG
jgi:RNA polymerase II subunit A-like phosphatase